MLRHVVGRLCGAAFFLGTLGRVRGRRFIWMPPYTLKIERGGSVRIGEDVMIGRGARVVARGAELAIGDSAFVSHNVTLVAYDDLTIGARTLIAENCSIHTENHGPAGDRDAFTSAPIEIGRQVWLGSGVAVLSGSIIGPGATVGANAVVKGELDAGGTYVGVPARRIR